MISAPPELQTKQQGRDESTPAITWVRVPREDYQSDSNGYLIFVYGNKYQPY